MQFDGAVENSLYLIPQLRHISSIAEFADDFNRNVCQPAFLHFLTSFLRPLFDAPACRHVVSRCFPLTPFGTSNRRRARCRDTASNLI